MLRTLESLFGPGVDFCGRLIGRLFTHTCKAWNLGKKSCPNHPVVPAIPCALSLLTAAANMGAQWLPWHREAHWLPIPSAGLVTSQQTPFGKSGQMSATNAQMTPFDTIIWPIFPKGNRPMSRPQKSTPGPNRDSKVPS